jgi:3-hydroxyisobutyrate dehydrogenase
MKVGMIGLGAMGEPIAGHLAAKSLLCGVWNRNTAKAQQIAEKLHVRAANSPAELAQICEVIILCVSADVDVLAVFDALKASLRAGQILIDTSTVSRETARLLAQECKSRKVGFLDAPLTGGVEGAKNARLSIMVGGQADVLERARPVLESFSARITHMGDAGAGQASKAVNQVIVAGIAQAVCEALAFAERLGLPGEQLLNVLQGGAANSWFLEKRGATMMAGQFQGGFKLALLLKDLYIVRAMATAQGHTLSVVEQSIIDYTALVEEGHADEEISALIRRKR